MRIRLHPYRVVHLKSFFRFDLLSVDIAAQASAVKSLHLANLVLLSISVSLRLQIHLRV